MVESAAEKIEAESLPPPAGTSTIQETLAAFRKWLKLRSQTPVLAALGAAAANYLKGDPVWLGIVGPGSSAKTEILLPLSRLPDVRASGPLTQAGLLSGVPKKDRDKGSKGGLLRELGVFGIITLKDFGSILSMHTETAPSSSPR